MLSQLQLLQIISTEMRAFLKQKGHCQVKCTFSEPKIQHEPVGWDPGVADTNSQKMGINSLIFE